MERIESQLKPFSRVDRDRAFDAIDEITRDSEHWKITTRSLLALNEEEEEGARQVLIERRSQRSIASLANRVLIETAQYAGCESKRDRLSRADHSRLLADVELLMTVANHRDAIAYGFLEPRVQVIRRKVLTSINGFMSVMRSTLHRSNRLTDAAARSYDIYFPGANSRLGPIETQK